MLKNYYEILNGAPTASPERIREAYRQAARQHHPDRVGSHGQMVLVNEAWAILSDPQTRSSYDQIRNAKSGEGDWLQQTAEVRRTAHQYPKEWSAFEKWLNNIAADLEATKYKGPALFWLSNVNTVSGAICLLLGIFALLWIFQGTELAPGGASNSMDTLRKSVYLVFAGSWLGYGLHYLLRKFMGPVEVAKHASRATQAAASTADLQIEILSCPICGRRLRIPKIGRDLEVKCPNCQRKFPHKVSSQIADS